MINPEYFKVKIEQFNPYSQDYKDFWRFIRRGMIEGYWVSGYYMPPQLFYYINLHHIKLNKKKADGTFANNKTIGKPFLQDTDWKRARIFLEARGFSGFSLDTKYHCISETKKKFGVIIPNNKTYIHPREYLQRNHGISLGKPLYQNQAYNVFDLEARECFGKGTEVLMFDGTIKNVEDIIVGDLLMGPDSTSRYIKKIHTGIDDLYKVNPKKDITPLIVNKNHRLQVKYLKHTNGKYEKGKIRESIYNWKETDFRIEDLFNKQYLKSFTNNYYLYQSNAISYPEQYLKIDPYYLGLWLSDGRSNCTSIKITDNTLWDYLRNFAKTNNITYKEIVTKKELNRKEAREFYYNCSNFREYFKDEKLINNKHIPFKYTIGSVEQRLQLLAGLIDGDGTYDKKCNNFSICCGVKKDLADSLRLLIRSLGFYSSVKKDIETNYSKKEVKLQDIYHVLVSGNIHTIPTKLIRKKAPNIKRRINVTHSSFNIEYLGKGEYFGFELDKDHLFVTKDFIVQHNSGKSMFASAVIAHNYLTDGILDYDEYLEESKNGVIYTSESLISSVDQKYSNDLAAKVRLALDNLEGDQTINGNYFPCPLKKVESGSLAKTLKASKEVQIKGVKQVVGSGSLIHNITFGSDEFAGAGKRPSVAIVDEVGFAFLLKEILSNMKDATYSSSDKFGTIWNTGTGGEMSASAINNIKEVFYNPEAFDCLVFKDEWENKGKCGLFFPKWETVRDFKDKNGNTRIEESKADWEKQYQKALDSKDSIVINKFLINSPGCPSHAFLTKDGNKFPVDLIEKQIVRVRSTKELLEKGVRGDIFLENGIAIFKDENQLKKRYYEVPFPYNRDKDTGYGCVTIYEFPKSTKDFVYISSMDPVAHEVGDSLPSIFIYKRSTLDDSLGDIIVAEITGRFDKFKDHLERSRLLLIFYNATCLYENSHNHFKEHMDNKFSLKYLALTPSTFSATVTLARRYGLPMSNPDLRLELEQYAYDWMLEPNPAGGINLDYVYQLNLLEELKIYDGNKTNTDRADAFIILIGYKISLTKKVVKEKQESDFYKFMNRKQRVE